MADTSDDDDLLHLYDPSPLISAEDRRWQEKQKSNDAAAEQALRARRVAYQKHFVLGMASPDDIELIMLDLARFCRGFESTFGEDERTQSRLDGRREVFLRIMDFTRLDYDELMLKYHRS